jgi:hypothetical protein
MGIAVDNERKLLVETQKVIDHISIQLADHDERNNNHLSYLYQSDHFTPMEYIASLNVAVTNLLRLYHGLSSEFGGGGN